MPVFLGGQTPNRNFRLYRWTPRPNPPQSRGRGGRIEAGWQTRGEAGRNVFLGEWSILSRGENQIQTEPYLYVSHLCGDGGAMG